MSISKTLLEEDNVISLRTALILDDGNTVYFTLMPANLESLIPEDGKFQVPKDFECISKDRAWLYRYLRSSYEERKLSVRFPRIIENFIKPLAFERPPKFKLLWSDSGNGVVLY